MEEPSKSLTQREVMEMLLTIYTAWELMRTRLVLPREKEQACEFATSVSTTTCFRDPENRTGRERPQNSNSVLFRGRLIVGFLYPKFVCFSNFL